MKKNLFWAASIACLCASCANDAVIDENRATDEIRFRAFAEGSTRAVDVFCPTNLHKEFTVYATDASSNLIIDGDIIKFQNNAWENTSATRYWPEEGTLTFEALLNGSKNSDGKVNFTVEDDAASQTDLIYARSTGSKADGTVSLNFRHALSQIVFQAKNTNETLTVEIEEVVLGNVNNSGVYTLPTENTTLNTAADNDHEGDSYQTTGRGSWASLSGSANYSVASTLTLEGETDATAISTANGNDALMLIPSSTNAWDKTTAIDADDLSSATGAFFLLKVKISQKVNDSETAAYIWGSEDEAKYLAIPVSFAWAEGKRYVYTFNFGQGNGGVDPENPENPVFVPITFDVTVDEFVSANESIDAGGSK